MTCLTLKENGLNRYLTVHFEHWWTVNLNLYVPLNQSWWLKIVWQRASKIPTVGWIRLGSSRLSGWSPKDTSNQWPETLTDIAVNSRGAIVIFELVSKLLSDDDNEDWWWWRRPKEWRYVIIIIIAFVLGNKTLLDCSVLVIFTLSLSHWNRTRDITVGVLHHTSFGPWRLHSYWLYLT